VKIKKLNNFDLWSPSSNDLKHAISFVGSPIINKSNENEENNDGEDGEQIVYMSPLMKKLLHLPKVEEPFGEDN
jgi:hypothetical protein